MNERSFGKGQHGNENGEPKEDFGQLLTPESVNAITTSFMTHIAENWGTYKDNLPNLRRTMMYYNEFAYGIRYLPENQHYELEFNPKNPLLDGDLEEAFGDKYTDVIGNLVYDAWPLRREFKPWEGYQEPIEDTPEALMEAHLALYHNIEEARKAFENTLGTDREIYQGKIMHVGPSGIPHIFYKGFTTVEEFPAQKEFLDTIRNNPRIQYGIALMEQAYEDARVTRERDDERMNKIKKIVNKGLTGEAYSTDDVEAISAYLNHLTGLEPQEE